MPERLLIPGPAGSLEAELHEPESTAQAAIAVLCHPHPQYGGSMDDMVLGILAEALRENGIATLRFNFRGVGASDGSYAGGDGEQDDLRSVLAWAAAEHPDRQLLLGGYSFGASVASRVAPDSGAQRLLLVAPPVGNLPLPTPDGSMPVQVFVGSEDAFVDLDRLGGWTSAEVRIIEGADHFFSGRWDALADAIRHSLG